MPTQESKFLQYNRMEFEAEVDVSAAAAVTATRGDGVTCTKSATATYTFVFKGNTHGQKMYKVLNRHSDLNGTPATATRSVITSITQATDGSDDITVVVKMTNAAFAETATTGACVLTLSVCIQTARMDMPFA
jgi:hypothetical protein